ncbi:MAG: hypothetical protein ACI9FN_003809 [Saprospiraceae bacterium]
MTLSCRSDARNLETANETKKVEATIAYGSLDEALESAEVALSKDPEVSEDKEALVLAVSSATKGSQNEEIIPIPENVGNVVQTKVAPTKTTRIEEISESIIETPPEKVRQEAELGTNDKSPDSQKTEIYPPVNKEDEVTVVKEVEIEKEPTPIVANIHDVWDALLKKYVSSSGFVDYKGLKSEQSKLDVYLEALAENSPKDSDLSKSAMAYYINLYNAATVKLILDNYPLASIKEINGGEPWSKEWINLGGKKYSLNNIEHDILRPRFKDERVHFAVNCASASCPKIANRAFNGSDLETLLEKLTREFINDSKLNSIDPKGPQLSKLFQWYQGDFDNVIDFVNQYSEVKVSTSAKITYKDYLWNLNGK